MVLLVVVALTGKFLAMAIVKNCYMMTFWPRRLVFIQCVPVSHTILAGSAKRREVLSIGEN